MQRAGSQAAKLHAERRRARQGDTRHQPGTFEALRTDAVRTSAVRRSTPKATAATKSVRR